MPNPAHKSSINEMKRLAKSRLFEAKHLFRKKKFDGSHYLCGYAVEFGLKVKICEMLKWSSYPPPGLAPKLSQALKTHNLEELLVLSGQEDNLKNDAAVYQKWSSDVTGWSSEQRYKPVGTINKQVSEKMIEATSEVLKLLRVI